MKSSWRFHLILEAFLEYLNFAGIFSILKSNPSSFIGVARYFFRPNLAKYNDLQRISLVFAVVLNSQSRAMGHSTDYRRQMTKLLTAQPKSHSGSQIFRYGQSIFCLPHRPNFSDIFDLCLHWVWVRRSWISHILANMPFSTTFSVTCMQFHSGIPAKLMQRLFFTCIVIFLFQFPSFLYP